MILKILGTLWLLLIWACIVEAYVYMDYYEDELENKINNNKKKKKNGKKR